MTSPAGSVAAEVFSVPAVAATPATLSAAAPATADQTGRLDRPTQLAFLTQDAVAKRVAEAGFVRLDLAGTERRTA